MLFTRTWERGELEQEEAWKNESLRVKEIHLSMPCYRQGGWWLGATMRGSGDPLKFPSFQKFEPHTSLDSRQKQKAKLKTSKGGVVSRPSPIPSPFSFSCLKTCLVPLVSKVRQRCTSLVSWPTSYTFCFCFFNVLSPLYANMFPKVQNV